MIPATRSSRVAAGFDAAQHYDDNARVQSRVADALAQRIAALPVVAVRGARLRLLEIGCGTGLLTCALYDRGLGGNWLVTDIAPRMLDRCASSMAGRRAGPDLEFAQLDGEAVPSTLPRGGFDLICSSMAFQWFTDLRAALAALGNLLSPGGVLAFSTLVSGTFSEWERAHHELGMQPGGLIYPGLEALSACFPKHGSLAIAEIRERETHANALAFLRSLKGIGASTSRTGRRPLASAALRRVMAVFDAAGARATYRVALCTWTKSPIKDDPAND